MVLSFDDARRAPGLQRGPRGTISMVLLSSGPIGVEPGAMAPGIRIDQRDLVLAGQVEFIEEANQPAAACNST